MSNITSDLFTTFGQSNSLEDILVDFGGQNFYLEKLEKRTETRQDFPEIDLLSSRESVIIKESWVDIKNVHARVVKYNKSLVTCECLVDKENALYENRSYPSILFQSIRNLQKNKLILISLKSKPGSSRIDIHNGEGLVNLSDFVIEDKWSQIDSIKLESRGFNL